MSEDVALEEETGRCLLEHQRRSIIAQNLGNKWLGSYGRQIVGTDARK